MGWSRHHPTGLIFSASQLCYPGYTLFANAGGGAQPGESGKYANLIDLEGRICHRWRHDEGIRYGHLLLDGNLLCRTRPPESADLPGHAGGAAAAIIELDWDSNVVWEYRNSYLHHDFVRLPSGNTLLLFWQPMPEELTSRIQGGYKTDNDSAVMFGDVIREVTPDGDVVFEWRSWEYLDPLENIICPLENREEWTHGNSLAVMPDGDILVSFRKTSVVAIVSRESGEIKWKWGPGEVSHQHHASPLDNGRLLLFDNGSHRRGMDYSRVIEVEPFTGQIGWEYQGDPPVSFYSYHISGAERLPNGNTLICEGAHGRLFEVRPDKDIVWEYVNPFFSSGTGVERANWVFRAHRYGPDHPALRGRDLRPKLLQ